MAAILKNITDATEVKEGDYCTICGWENIRTLCNAVLVDESLNPYEAGVTIAICEVCADKIGI